MTGYVLDTNHASLLYRHHPRLTKRVDSSSAPFYLCQPSIGELWFMVYNSTRVGENEAHLRHFTSLFNVLEFNAPAAIEFGRIKAELRRIGRGIGDVDAQIAAVVRVHDLILLTDDRDFEPVSRLRKENWLR